MAIPTDIVPPPRKGSRPSRRSGAGPHDLRPNRQRQRGQAKRAAITRALQDAGVAR